MSTSLTPEQIAELIAKDQAKSRPWHARADTPLCHFEARIAVRLHWQDFYRQIDERLDDFVLENPLRELFDRSMSDGTAGRRNAGSLTTAGYLDASGKFVQLELSKASGGIREYLHTQYSGGVTASGTSNTRVFGWTVAANRRGDEVGWYADDHSVDFGYHCPSADPAYVDQVGGAMFAMFVATLERFPPVAGWVTMSSAQWNRKFDHDNHFFHSPPDRRPFTAGYHWGLFIPNEDLEALGGRDAVSASAPVEQVVPIEPAGGGSSPGVAVQVCRDITALDEDRLERWRAYLAPVLDLAEPSMPGEGEPRPVDVLERDWRPGLIR